MSKTPWRWECPNCGSRSVYWANSNLVSHDVRCRNCRTTMMKDDLIDHKPDP